MPEESALRSNVPEFSVSDLSQSLKRTIEENFGRVRVRGELSRISIAASGHMYSTLKDENACIDAVCWKGTMAKLSVKPEEGLEVICTGRLTTYPQRSNYQLVIDSMELAGEGALLKMLEERKKKLAAEGLFDPARKKPIPFLPQVIGVVTSPTGAVIRDILHRLEDRFPRRVLVWPVLVQGAGASEQVAAAINGFQNMLQHNLPKPDLIIVARGGGSLEDLMPFNEEIVVRAVAASAIPVISAVGHETDTTLCDFAADLRAPTPTGAAEMAVPVRANLWAQVQENGQRLHAGMQRFLSEKHHRLEAARGRLGDPAHVLETKAQRLDHASDKLAGVFTRYLHKKEQQLSKHIPTHPRERLKNAAQKLERWSDQLETIGPKLTKDKQTKLQHMASMLEAYSFKNVLRRGFAVIRDEHGKILSDATQISNDQILDIELRSNGHVKAKTFAAKKMT
jgi:exodeoxyribonuclease VII large subunit